MEPKQEPAARRSAPFSSARRVVALLAIVAGLTAVGLLVVPVAVPNLTAAMERSPLVPLMVAMCWVLATLSSVAGKRVICAGYLDWTGTATAHVGGTVANRVVPAGVGAAGVFVAALHRGGATTTVAAGVVALWAAAGGLAHGAGLLLGLAWLREGWYGVLAAVVALIVLAIGVRLIAIRIARAVREGRWSPRWRLRRRPPESDAVGGRIARLRSAVRDMVAVVRARPVMALAAVGAQLVSTLCLAAGFAAAATGLGVPVNLGVGMAAYLAGTALAAAMPTPAGIGSAETALVGALMLAGAGVGEALPAVLLFRAVILLAPVVTATAMGAAWLTRRAARCVGNVAAGPGPVVEAVAAPEPDPVIPAPSRPDGS
ncbi:lysylphosphatidylglycerol synthase domain-containing protein [Jiangella asiatica]|nr:lysylphosphatidylglycerol synthase domain-containing protein [Jiangella asiatica]